jgi:hypothetical protein
MRQLFRKEYAKEVEDTQMALEASLGPGSLSMSSTSLRSQAALPLPVTGAPSDEVPHVTAPAEPPAVDGDKPRGFWGSLFKKRK